MRLDFKALKAMPRSEKITLPGEVAEDFGDYLKFYQKIYGNAIDSEKLIIEILRRFMKTDRDFIQYRQSNVVTAKPGTAI